MSQYNNYGASYANAGGYDPYAAAGAGAAGGVAAGAYGQHHGGYSDEPYGDQNYGNGYEPVQQNQGQYYFDPREASAYQDLPSSQQPLSPQQYDDAAHQYDDPYAGYAHYDSGNGSVDNTPLERENPLQVTNPTHQAR